MRVGLDGLTEDELRRSRRGFWDAAFTSLLLARVPADAATLVDVGCGLANAAHELLPHRSSLAYVGIDADEARLATARDEIAASPVAARVQLVEGRAERLPLPDGCADVVLTTMTLQHLVDVAAALAEARRVLRDGGRILAVEPDNLGQRFYFDAELPDVNDAFRDLAAAVRQARLPADLAIGPTLGKRIGAAGFD